MIHPARAAIGALMQLPVPKCAAVLDRLRDDDPDDPRLRMILASIRALVADGRTADPVIVFHELHTSGRVHGGDLGALGVLLSELVSVETCPMPSLAEQYATVAIESAVRRRISEAAERITYASNNSGVEALVGVLQAEFQAVADEVDRLPRPASEGGAE